MSDQPERNDEPASGEHAAEQRPVLRVVRGKPDDVEVAALTSALTSALSGRAASTAAEPARRAEPRSWWNDRADLLRHPLRPGPGAWRAAAWPR